MCGVPWTRCDRTGVICVVRWSQDASSRSSSGSLGLAMRAKYILQSAHPRYVSLVRFRGNWPRCLMRLEKPKALPHQVREDSCPSGKVCVGINTRCASNSFVTETVSLPRQKDLCSKYGLRRLLQ